MNEGRITCYDHSASQSTGNLYFPQKLKLGFKAHPNGEESDINLKGSSFGISGRQFSTIHGYYVDMDARDLTKSKSETLKLLKKNWVDSYTKYVGFVMNFYDPRFKIMMYYMIFYDQRFSYDLLSSVKSMCYLTSYAQYTSLEIILVIYTCIAGVACVGFVIIENLEIIKGKFDKQEQYDRLQRIDSSSTRDIRRKVHFMPLNNKTTMMVSLPNFFQLTSTL